MSSEPGTLVTNHTNVSVVPFEEYRQFSSGFSVRSQTRVGIRPVLDVNGRHGDDCMYSLRSGSAPTCGGTSTCLECLA
jgi:hypothetical protein